MSSIWRIAIYIFISLLSLPEGLLLELFESRQIGRPYIKDYCTDCVWKFYWFTNPYQPILEFINYVNEVDFWKKCFWEMLISSLIIPKIELGTSMVSMRTPVFYCVIIINLRAFQYWTHVRILRILSKTVCHYVYGMSITVTLVNFNLFLLRQNYVGIILISSI